MRMPGAGISLSPHLSCVHNTFQIERPSQDHALELIDAVSCAAATALVMGSQDLLKRMLESLQLGAP